MKMIGKIFSINLFGGVIEKVDKKNVIEGDSVTFSITADGSKIEFPKIDKIEGYNIESISNSENIVVINGKYKKSLTRSWTFTPLKSIKIPSYIVKIDGKDYKTKSIFIKVVKDSKFNKKFKLEVEAEKSGIVGYPLPIVIKFYQKTNTNISTIQMSLPKGDFILKQVGKEKDYFDGVYKVAEVHYVLIPKKEGIINFDVFIKLGFAKSVIDEFGFINNIIKYKTISKSLKIKVKKIYNGLIGDFNISIKVDKNRVKINKPINGKLIIEGYGNLSNLSDIKINIPNVTLYDNKPKITQSFIENKIYSKYEKDFVLLADSNFTIPPVEISYYNLKKKKEENISTKPIFIEVYGNKENNKIFTSQNQPKIVTKVITKYKENYFLTGILFFIGIIVGYLLSFIKIKTKIELPKNLYNKLLPYADVPKIKEILEKLYNKQNLTKEDKKFIKEFFENRRSIKN